MLSRFPLGVHDVLKKFGTGAALAGFLLLTPALQAGDGAQKAVVCAACHNADGNSTNPEWPKLAGQGARYLQEQLKAFKEGARKNAIMAPLAAGLSGEDVKAVAEYFAAQKRKIGAAKPELIGAGERLYRGGNNNTGVPACMACHGPRGSGNPAAGYPALSGQHAVYTARQLDAYRTGERVTDNNAIMRMIAAHLSAAEIEAVASYIEGLH
jgi:cytochrome c553